MSGVQFPADAQGKRATTGPAKAIWSAAFAGVDDAAVAALGAEHNWRKNYAHHVVPLTRASVRTPELTLQVAQQGLAAVHGAFEFVRGSESGKLAEAMDKYTDVPRHGSVTSTREAPFSTDEAMYVPVDGGERKTGEELLAFVDKLVKQDRAEPDVAAAYRELAANVETWRESLKDTYFVLLGATSELCPLEKLLELGLNVVAIARPSPARQARLVKLCQEAPAGASLTLPVLGDVEDDKVLSDPEQLPQLSGADILQYTPEVANWLCSLYPGKRLVIGSYIYLDGAKHVLASVAMDAVIARVMAQRPDTGLMYLGTPAVVYPITRDAWTAAEANRKKSQPFWHALAQPVLGYFKPNVDDPVVADSVAPAADTTKEIFMYNGILNVQGPNYLLAKTLQNWRAMVARDVNKCRVSVNMTPACRTDSVMHVAAVARAVHGMKVFPPMTSYEPGTAKSLMGLLLIYDMCAAESPANPETALRNPMEIFATLGVHGGLWRSPFSQESTSKASYVAGFFS